MHLLLLGAAHLQQYRPPGHTWPEDADFRRHRAGRGGWPMQCSGVCHGLWVSSSQMCSPSPCSARCLLRAGAVSRIAARGVYLMLTDRHINSLTLPANADPGLKTKNPRGIAVRFHKA